MADQPFFQFPRWYPNRGMGNGGSGGPFGPTGNAANAFGDIIGGLIENYQAKQQAKKADDLANALMNNGQSPGAAPYVRRATYEDGDQGDDPGPVPFASVDQPYEGGQQLAAALAGNASDAQKAQQQQLQNALASGRLNLAQQRLSQGKQGRPLSAMEQYGIDHPEYVPPSGRKTFAPPRTPGQSRSSGRKSNLLPIGLDDLPSDDATARGAENSSVSTAQPGAAMNLYNTVMGATPNIGNGQPPNPPGSPDPGNARGAEDSIVDTDQPGAAKPSATPLVAQGGVQQVTSDADFAKLPSGTRFRDPNGKIRIKP